MCHCSGFPQPGSSVQNSHSLTAQALFRAARLLLCCQSSLYSLLKERMEKGVGNILELRARTESRDSAGQTSRASLPRPCPLALPLLPRSWVESGAASAGPGWHWHCISSGPAPCPPLPSAQAPAVLACSSKLKAKPAVESTALVHGGLILESRGCTAPTAASQPTGLCCMQGCAHRRPGAHPTGEARVLWDQALGELLQHHSTCAELWLCQGAPRSRCRCP